MIQRINRGLERLKQLNLTRIPTDDILNKKTIYEKDIPNYEFYNSCRYHDEYKVPIQNVVGTCHIDYINRSWLEMLGCLKRFDGWTKDKFLNYVQSNNKYSGLYYYKYGNDFIVREGNHRTCLAIVCGLEHIKTDICEFIFDDKLYTAYTKLVTLNLLDPNFKFNLVRNYNPSERVWILQLNNRSIYIRNQNSLDYFLNLFQSLRCTLISYYTSFLKQKLFNLDAHFYISINSIQDVDKLVDDIILHKRL